MIKVPGTEGRGQCLSKTLTVQSEGVSVGIQNTHKRQGTVLWEITEFLQAWGRGMASSADKWMSCRCSERPCLRT